MKSAANQQKKWRISVLLAAIVLTVCLSLAQPAFSYPRDRVAGNMMLINDNGGWCWYQDEKIIYDPVGGNILTSTAADNTGFGGVGGDRHSDMDATTFNIATGKRTRVNAREGYGGDDHNMGAFWIRSDGRYMHFYCTHYTNPARTYYRVSTNPNDGSSWGSEQYFDWEVISGLGDQGNLTYTNIHYMSDEGTGSGRLYNIVRWNNTTPNIAFSDDEGATWDYMGKLNDPAAAGYSNYYHKFVSNGIDRIDFIGVEQHPRNYNNSVFHGYIKGGKSYNSYGVEIDDDLYDQDAPSITEFTPIFVADPDQDEDSYHTGWTNEIQLDKDGYPVCLYQTRYGTEEWGNGSGQNTIGAADHRFFYARFDGSSWTSTELGKMGVGLHLPEQDYIGMGCIHPNDVNIVYIATPFDPRDDMEYENHELFKGITYDNGLTWDWTQITFDSTELNVRPAIPLWDPYNTAVVWQRGRWEQTSYENYDLVVVGLVEEEDATLGLVSYIDATESNTEEADETPFEPTGPDGNPGAMDDQWHEYTGYGNGGSCYTAGDGGTEDAPTIKTTITGLSDGTYDVFAYFWSDPNANWGIRGGFESTDMLCFNKQSSQHAEASQFAGSVDVLDTGVALYRIYIGRKVISGGGSIDVYLDNYDGSYSGDVPTRTTYDGVGVASISYVEDLLPPEPNEMTWDSVPTATGPSTITMTATTATDDSPPVQYYFECTTDGSASSGWQTNPTYVAEDLTPSTLYSFRVKARDSSPAQNETDWSSTESATTEPPDTTPPTPEPTWASPPTATGPTSITMTSTTATDAESPPVYYYFECTNYGDANSGWQLSETYVATGLTPNTQYTFKVKARDDALIPNETGWSEEGSATTELPPTDVEIIGSWATGQTHAKESGTNRALIFIAHVEHNANISLTSVTYGGKLMEPVIDEIVGTGWRAYVAAYRLDEAGIADANSGTFEPQWSTEPSYVAYSSAFFQNVNQATPIGDSNRNGTASSSPNPITTVPLATNDGDMVILGATAGNNGSYILQNDFDEGNDQTMGGTATGVTGYKAATGATETPSAEHSNPNRQVIIGFVVQAGGIPGDLNGDGIVDLIDFAILGREWLTTYDMNTLDAIADNWLYGT